MAGIHLYKDITRYKQNLINDLQKYGNLNLAIKNLKGKQIVLKSKKKTRHQKKQRKNISQQSKTKYKKKIAT
jgi:hypothetical protein